MGVSFDLKAVGVEELKKRLLEKKEAMKRVLDMRLLQVAEEAVTHAKTHKGYKDRTANLKNSISFALFYDGVLISKNEGSIPEPDKRPKGQSEVSDSLDRFSNLPDIVAPKGYTLIVVAGMNYGVYVEHKGYNVLHLTKFYIEDELVKAFKETIEDVLI